MTLEFRKLDNISKREMNETIETAITDELTRAQKTRMLFRRECYFFEKKYKVSSDVFLEEFRNGKFQNNSEYFDWFAAKVGLDIWARKFNVLSAVHSVKSL